MSLSLFWWRLTLGDASVRFRRSDANSDQVAGSAAHRPLSWASERATICSYVRFPDGCEPSACVGAVYAALGIDDAWFD